jgi:hypothetical protein
MSRHSLFYLLRDINHFGGGILLLWTNYNLEGALNLGFAIINFVVSRSFIGRPQAELKHKIDLTLSS